MSNEILWLRGSVKMKKGSEESRNCLRPRNSNFSKQPQEQVLLKIKLYVIFG